jgi:hypothetical protein
VANNATEKKRSKKQHISKLKTIILAQNIEDILASKFCA